MTRLTTLISLCVTTGALAQDGGALQEPHYRQRVPAVWMLLSRGLSEESAERMREQVTRIVSDLGQHAGYHVNPSVISHYELESLGDRLAVGWVCDAATAPTVERLIRPFFPKLALVPAEVERLDLGSCTLLGADTAVIERSQTFDARSGAFTVRLVQYTGELKGPDLSIDCPGSSLETSWYVAALRSPDGTWGQIDPIPGTGVYEEDPKCPSRPEGPLTQTTTAWVESRSPLTIGYSLVDTIEGCIPHTHSEEQVLTVDEKRGELIRNRRFIRETLYPSEWHCGKKKRPE